MTKFDHVDVLRRARQILADGGDDNPCSLGAFCLRCCCAKAKGQLDREHGTGVPLSEALLDLVSEVRERPSDRPLVLAVNMIRTYDTGVKHSQGSALMAIDFALADAAQADLGAGI